MMHFDIPHHDHGRCVQLPGPLFLMDDLLPVVNVWLRFIACLCCMARTLETGETLPPVFSNNLNFRMEVCLGCSQTVSSLNGQTENEKHIQIAFIR